MKNNYIVELKGYSLTGLLKMVNTVLYGKNNVVPMAEDIPFNSCIIDDRNNVITWGFEFKSQQKRFIHEITKILKQKNKAVQ